VTANQHSNTDTVSQKHAAQAIEGTLLHPTGGMAAMDVAHTVPVQHTQGHV
jgi:hypothetical protein